MEDDTLYKEDLPFFFCERQEDDKTDKRYSLLPPPSHRAAVSMADSEGVGEKTTDREGEGVGGEMTDREGVGGETTVIGSQHTHMYPLV
jgi:hypothetical protein